MELERLQENARRASTLLKAMSNQHRLLILCRLVQGEKCVSELEKMIGLSQSALSQHLARLRADKLVDFRKDGQMAFYRIADERVENLLLTLQHIFS